MSSLKKMFGAGNPSKSPEPTEERPAPLAKLSHPKDPAQDPNMIRVFDAYGRELFISKEEWRKNVLPGSIQSNWNKPDELYNIIVGSLNDGFRSDVIDATRHLYQIDTDPMRSACLWGIVLMEEQHLDEAEKIFRSYTAMHGEQGVILTNLAKVCAARHENAKSLEILWHALELDPNQDNGLGWYEVIHREKEGVEAGLAALRRVAALPHSWRARLWLARAALEGRNPDEAMKFYREALGMVDSPAPTDLLTQISGDLGNNGRLPQILELVEPLFQVESHGLQVGNNLLKANLDLGRIDAAKGLLDRLFAQKRPDWQQNLAFWDTEIAKLQTEVCAAGALPEFQITMITIDGPLWLRKSNGGTLGWDKPVDAVRIAFLGSSVASAPNGNEAPQLQMSDTPGRLSRMLPIFLAEQSHLLSSAVGRLLQPWIVTAPGGFVLSGVAWADDTACHSARQGDEPADYLVVTHLETVGLPWVAKLRLLRTIDGVLFAEHAVALDPEQPATAFASLSDYLREHYAQLQVATVSPPSWYQLPPAQSLVFYLLRLEQALAVLIAALEHIKSGFLSGEREILNGNIQLCLECPSIANIRLLLAQTLSQMNRFHPGVVEEFRGKVTLLQSEKPLLGDAGTLVEQLFAEVFPT